ncbi:hypothetical protein SAMN06295974_3708 [Plantibacter flavus]|uniref:Uncharacterized protein n=2 Tax=Plantibacter flavus TaxID=150123 RepID=A0A3N2BM77_9MICO|nr:hypothetical protein EDD42_4097 [Plantibacter flavus]SMG48275.1 hypothetical protein SAMN06295974_3708 [Plantibacter flavus]
MSTGALRDGANSYQQRYPLAAKMPGRPWTVHLADDEHRYQLACFDFDVKDGASRVQPELVEQAQDQADRLVQLLGDLHIPHVLCESSATGGRHVWMRTLGIERETMRTLGMAARNLLSTLDFGMLSNPATGSARPPGAPHRDGSMSRVLAGDVRDLALPSLAVSQDQLEALTDRLAALAPPLQPEPHSPITSGDSRENASPRQMPAKNVARFQLVGGGPDPSVNAFICLLAALSAGWSFDDVARAVQTSPGLEHYRTRRTTHGRRRRPQHETAAKLAADWDRAVDIHALNEFVPLRRAGTSEPAPDVDELAAQLLTITDLQTSFRVQPGRWGGNDGSPMQRAILTAIAWLTLHTGRTEVAAATRTIAEIVGVSSPQVWEHLERLRTSGLLVRVDGGFDDKAPTWRLAPHRALSTPSELDRALPSEGSDEATPRSRSAKHLFIERRRVLDELQAELLQIRHDVFSYRGGLGQLGARLWVTLGEHEQLTVAETARLVGISEMHAAGLLSRLRSLKLARFISGAWVRAARDLRTAAARRLGVLGRLKARAKKYAQDRELHAWWLDHERRRQGQAPKTRPEMFDSRGRPLHGSRVPFKHRLFPRFPIRWDGRADYASARERVQSQRVYGQDEFFAVRVELPAFTPSDPLDDWSPENLYGSETINRLRRQTRKEPLPHPADDGLLVDLPW